MLGRYWGVLFALFFVMVVCMSSDSAFACYPKCPTYFNIVEAPVIFSGKIVERNEEGDIRFEVIRMYKGPEGENYLWVPYVDIADVDFPADYEGLVIPGLRITSEAHPACSRSDVCNGRLAAAIETAYWTPFPEFLLFITMFPIFTFVTAVLLFVFYFGWKYGRRKKKRSL